MARDNKYTSINFNHVFDKNVTNNSNNTNSFHNNTTKQSPSASYKSHLSHGRMLVLTRPTPKPAPVSNISSSSTAINTPPLSPSIQVSSTQLPVVLDQGSSDSQSDLISLRPSGRTGSNSGFNAVQIPEVKSNKFVPPHLRPGFAGKEEKPGPEVFKGKERPQHQHQQQQGHVGYGSGSGSPGGYLENGRPKSGGGYERMKSDLAYSNRPRCSGNRPSSSG